MRKLIEIVYFENIDRTWDAHAEGKQLVKAAPTYTHANIFVRVLLQEEHDEYFIDRETIIYYKR